MSQKHSKYHGAIGAWTTSAVLGVVIGVCPSAAIAQKANLPQHQTEQVIVAGPATRTLMLGEGRSFVYVLPVDAHEILIGDPKIANAAIRSPRKLYVIATGVGQTSIAAVDREGHEIGRLELNVGRDNAALEQILRTALPKSKIFVKTMNESLVLTGEANSAGDVATALEMAKAFIKRKSTMENNGDVVNALVVRSSDQVMVKVTIAEVQRSIIKQLGVSAAPNGSETVASGSWGVISQQNPFTVNGNISNSNMTVPLGLKGSVSLRAYERHGVTRVLAEPTVTAVSGETAKLTVGGEIAYPSSSTCGSGWGCTIGVAYKPYGITLNITPIVVAEGRILIRMATEVTEIDSSQSVTVASISVPSFRTRKNETSIELPSGGALATAGLLTNASRQAINGLPGLLNLPVLGALFRSRDYQRQETEMLIVVTPYIARSVNPNEIQRPDDGFVDATDPQGWLLGRVNKLYATKSNPQAVENWKGRFGFIQD